MKQALLFLGVILSSCSSTQVIPKYYDPAMLNNDISYLPKPMSGDLKKDMRYISIGAGQKVTDGESNKYDELLSLQLNLSQAHTFKNLNLAYGIFGVSGFLKNGVIAPGEPYHFNKKKFSALGVRGSVNSYLKKGDIDFRLIGAEFSYSKESGEFQAFRKIAFNKPSYYAVGNTELFTAGLTSEVIINIDSKLLTQLGTRLFVGKSFNTLNYSYSEHDFPKRSPRINNINIAFFGQLKRFYGVLESSYPGSHHAKVGFRF